MFRPKPIIPYERKYEIVMVDEADNMFIDQGTSPAIIARPIEVIHYRFILLIVYYNREKSIHKLQEWLNTIFEKCTFFKTKLGIDKIKELKNAALNADKYIKDIDYIIENNKIVIIDKII